MVLSYDDGRAGVGAGVGGQGVEVVEAAVVGVGGDAVYGAQCVDCPRGQDEQAATGTGVEAAALGFPVWTDGLFLQMDEWVAVLQAFVFHPLFAA